MPDQRSPIDLVEKQGSAANLHLGNDEKNRLGNILRKASNRSVRLALENGPLGLLAQVLERIADYSVFVHLRIRVDTGHIEWPEVFEELAKCGYSGQIIFELVESDPIGPAQQAKKFVWDQLHNLTP